MVKTDKGFYDRKIVYLDYLEKGAKVKNGGFVKWEAKGETSRIQIHIRGLYPTDTLRGEIQLISRQTVHTADNVKIDFGSGEYVGVWKNEDLAGTAVSYEECDGVQVKLSESRLLVGQWREREALQENQPNEILEVSEPHREIADRDGREETAISEEQPAEKEEMEAEGADGTDGKGLRTAETYAGVEEREMQRENGSEASAEMGVREEKPESVLEVSAGVEGRETKQESAPEVHAEAEEEFAEQKDMWEAPAKTEEREPEQEVMPQTSTEFDKGGMERESAMKAFSKTGEKGLQEESMQETSAKAEGGAAERKSAAETNDGRRGESARGKGTKSGEKKARQNPQCRDLLSGDKWEQLNKQYPHIHPFGDAREYLSITPRDFVILSRKYQELVQNSFLLHGYYNYGHVILTRIKEKNGERFYLGVPGVYYTREKQAALMFGFEGFEAGTEQAVDGGFGYYMKQVDI